MAMSDLLLELKFPRGLSRNHDYSELPNARIAGVLMETHRSLTNTGGGIKAPSTSVHYARVNRRFARFLDEENISSFDEITTEVYLRFCDQAEDRDARAIKIVLQRISENNPNLLNPSLERVIAMNIKRQPIKRAKKNLVEPLSQSEADALEQVCKAEIKSVEEHLSETEKILQKAVPEGEKLSDEKIIHYIAEAGPQTTNSLTEHFGIHRNTFSNQIGKRHRGLSELNQTLFPTREDLLPYLLLLGLKSGISPEGIAWLTRDSFTRIGQDRIRLQWTKNRSAGLEADTFPNKGQWSVGSLVERVIKITERSERFATEEDKQYLWLGLSMHGNTINRADQWGLVANKFVKKHNLRDSKGQLLNLDRRRLRKTFYACLDKKYQGAVNVISGANQSAQVAADHYLDANEETELISKTIEEAQMGMVNKAKQSLCTIIKDPDPDNIDIRDLLELSTDKATALLQTEQDDVFVAKCKDFYNSPYSEKGKPCQAAVWECLFCPLAVITPSKLPNILTLQDHINKALDSMSIDEWRQRYGSAHQVIKNDILPQFSDQVISAARQHAQEKELYFAPEEIL
jgi:hypothetical protein